MADHPVVPKAEMASVSGEPHPFNSCKIVELHKERHGKVQSGASGLAVFNDDG
jgi:hypothetical protein